ncbi:integrase [Kitasatospora sp. NBC_01246]|uniref:integrase n=1 Tax=Kitasatospora sp. NBC_01246 TaxID=2903570 RepID=UPI002E347FC3|nr:integrase [Kitasatospora sp. NBC_01246]
MLIATASAPNPGRANEDFVIASAETVIVLDGAGLPSAVETGCVHGVPWFVRNLGAAIFMQAAERPASLTECLADAIASTARLHAGTCDLANPMTPSATVVVARVRGGTFEWLTLADSTVALSLSTGIEVHADHRVSSVTDRQRVALQAELAHLQEGKRRVALAWAQREVMNTVDGYWVASTEPGAAEQSLTGAVSLSELHTAAILTDGAARAVDDFGVLGWPDLLRKLDVDGPHGLIEYTRNLERSDPQRRRWPRSKCHDDATAVLMRPDSGTGSG